MVFLLLPTFQVAAWSNFFENPYSPYPAGCGEAVDSHRVKFHDESITLLSTRNGPMPMVLRVYRQFCTEPGRSQIWLQFPTSNDLANEFYFTPSVRIVTGATEILTMSLAREPGSWNEGNGPSAYPAVFGLNNCEGNAGFCSVQGWSFMLDNSSPLGLGSALQYLMTAEEYNGRFTLELQPGPGEQVYRIDVPSTAELLDSRPAMPLSGRLSGLWVAEGASDQGFNIAISELAWTSDTPLFLFLTWYTFDADGRPLWFSGGVQFAFGASEVAFPLQLITDGEFAGGRAAVRQTAGNATLRVNDCNDLGLDYDLRELGLGAGSTRLQRLFSLELAGYACRDMAARRDALNK